MPNDKKLKFEVIFRAGEASLETEIVEAELWWTTESGHLKLVAGGVLQAEYSHGQWVRVRTVDA